MARTIGEKTGAVIEIRTIDEIAGKAVGAAGNGQGEGEVYRSIDVVSVQEDLRIDVSGQVAVRGQLSDEHALFNTGDSIGCTGEDEPSTPREVGNHEAASRHIARGFEDGSPRTRSGFEDGDRGFSRGRQGRFIDAYRDETVELIGRVVVPNDGIDARCRLTAYRIGLEEISSGLDGKGIFYVSIYAGDLVEFRIRGDVQPVGRIARQVGVTQDSDVFGDGIDFDGEFRQRFNLGFGQFRRFSRKEGAQILSHGGDGK